MTIKAEASTLSSHEAQNQFGEDDYLEDVVAPHLVWSYLIHHGYIDSATAFLKDWQQSSDSNSATSLKALKVARTIGFQTLELRKRLREWVLAADIESAVEAILKEYPKLSGYEGREMPSMAFFQLLCQHFLELVRAGRADDALKYAEVHLAPLANKFPAFSTELQNIIVILAYAEPANSPVKHLLSHKFRESIAIAINSAILEEEESRLERVMKQTVSVTELLGNFRQDVIAGGGEQNLNISGFLTSSLQ